MEAAGLPAGLCPRVRLCRPLTGFERLLRRRQTPSFNLLSLPSHPTAFCPGSFVR